MEKTNAVTKNNELITVLQSHFKGSLNLARVKLISYFIIALCKIQTVTFEKLANLDCLVLRPLHNNYLKIRHLYLSNFI